MKRMLMAIVAAGVLTCLAGCQTMIRDSDQQMEHYNRVAEINRRILAEDIDAILLLDRPSHLSRWHIRDKY